MILNNFIYLAKIGAIVLLFTFLSRCFDKPQQQRILSTEVQLPSLLKSRQSTHKKKLDKYTGQDNYLLIGSQQKYVKPELVG